MVVMKPWEIAAMMAVFALCVVMATTFFRIAPKFTMDIHDAIRIFTILMVLDLMAIYIMHYAVALPK